jgi:hypothetical protein
MNDGGQAFPSHPALYSTAKQGDAQGMTLRDWFAGQALASSADAATAEALAKKCYVLADAMLAARSPEDTAS